MITFKGKTYSLGSNKHNSGPYCYCWGWIVDGYVAHNRAYSFYGLWFGNCGFGLEIMDQFGGFGLLSVDDLADIDSLDLESFMDRYGTLRDNLSFDFHSNEELSDTEKSVLARLNKRLDELLPESSETISSADKLIAEAEDLVKDIVEFKASLDDKKS